jgi:N-acetylneuraminic acid mutarotase
VARANYPALGVVPTGPAEMSVYVVRHYGQPSIFIERLALRTDGFASLHGPYSGGEALTKPIRHSGRELEVNFATSAAGSLRVELQEPDRQPVPGFALADCAEVIGDQIDRVIRWRGGSDVSALAGRPLRLRFALKDADVYSFRFRSGPEADVGPVAPAAPRKLLSIAWKKGPSLPQGFQDSDGGIVDHTLVTVGGFCSGQAGVPGKEAKYPREFLRKAWGLDLRSPQGGWQSLPPLPGAARQEHFAIVVAGQLYCWGGFSYTAPFCYADGYRLSRREGAWTWDALPPLPWVLCSAGIAAIGSKIYVQGGGDYDENRFYTNTDRKGETQRLGARLLVLDTRDLAGGWKELSQCPGTPRFVHAFAAVNGKLYVVGGGTGNDNDSGHYCTVVDNWSFDPATARWERLADTPVATGNFPAGAIVFQDRYLVLVGGYQYSKVLNPDRSLRPAYGQVTKHYPKNDYNSDVLVFDTRTGTFGAADPLPLCNNLPMAVVVGDELHLIGGETGGSEIEGERFGHHPDLYLIGRFRVAE